MHGAGRSCQVFKCNTERNIFDQIPSEHEYACNTDWSFILVNTIMKHAFISHPFDFNESIWAFLSWMSCDFSVCVRLLSILPEGVRSLSNEGGFLQILLQFDCPLKCVGRRRRSYPWFGTSSRTCLPCEADAGAGSRPGTRLPWGVRLIEGRTRDVSPLRCEADWGAGFIPGTCLPCVWGWLRGGLRAPDPHLCPLLLEADWGAGWTMIQSTLHYRSKG